MNDYEGTLKERIVDVILTEAGITIDPWLAEEIADKIIDEILGE
jgi:hypothetical protein